MLQVTSETLTCFRPRYEKISVENVPVGKTASTFPSQNLAAGILASTNSSGNSREEGPGPERSSPERINTKTPGERPGDSQDAPDHDKIRWFVERTGNLGSPENRDAPNRRT